MFSSGLTQQQCTRACLHSDTLSDSYQHNHKEKKKSHLNVSIVTLCVFFCLFPPWRIHTGASRAFKASKVFPLLSHFFLELMVSL